MNQQNQGTHSAIQAQPPVKRRRGRPRKDENLFSGGKTSTTPGSDASKRNRIPKKDKSDGANSDMVGQVVCGVLEGSFDAGYLLTVKVGGTNTILRGVVFEPGLSVPLSAANDVAPHVEVFKRDEIPFPKVDPTTKMHDSSKVVLQITDTVPQVLQVVESIKPSEILPENEASAPKESRGNPSEEREIEPNDTPIAATLQPMASKLMNEPVSAELSVFRKEVLESLFSNATAHTPIADQSNHVDPDLKMDTVGP